MSLFSYAIEVWAVVPVVANTILNRFCKRAVRRVWLLTAGFTPITDFIRERD